MRISLSNAIYIRLIRRRSSYLFIKSDGAIRFSSTHTKLPRGESFCFWDLLWFFWWRLLLFTTFTLLSLLHKLRIFLLEMLLMLSRHRRRNLKICPNATLTQESEYWLIRRWLSHHIKTNRKTFVPSQKQNREDLMYQLALHTFRTTS